MNYIFLAPGFEEIEAIAPIDMLRRAGMEVTTVAVGVEGRGVSGAHGIEVIADASIDLLPETLEADWLILPGGMPGADNLHHCAKLNGYLTAPGAKIAAICASPAVVLGQLELLKGKPATCYPGFEHLCEGAEMTGAPVVSVPGLITAKGPGFAMDFALTIIAATCGQEVSEAVASGMLL